MIARLVRVLLVVALLAGWQAALVHPLEHFGASAGLVHLGDPDKQPEKSVLCDVVAALAACAASAVLAFYFFGSPVSVSAGIGDSSHPAEPPPFFAQGPPVSL